MKLSHLLLSQGLTVLLVFPLAWLQGLAGVNLPFQERVWISLPPALFAAVATAWPLARMLGIPPLMIFSGPCPSCTQRPAGWWKSAGGVDRWHLLCGECGACITLWLRSPRSTEITSPDEPTYVLRWPQFLGVWRRVC